jgi:uncharacterized protein (TIGR03435 family)
MLRKLMVDRLHLSVRREKKNLTVYALTVGKDGPKLVEDRDNPNGLPAFTGSGGVQGRNIRNATMAELAGELQGRVGRPVVDGTGLGLKRYDMVLKWTPDAAAPPAGDAVDAPPDIFAAIQEQPGLKLESTKAQVDVIVIDHVERPGAN